MSNVSEQPRPARMRLTEDQAAYLKAMLHSRRHILVVVRRGAMEGTAIEADLDGTNKEIRFIDRMLREIERCEEEKGWRNGQPK